MRPFFTISARFGLRRTLQSVIGGTIHERRGGVHFWDDWKTRWLRSHHHESIEKGETGSKKHAGSPQDTSVLEVDVKITCIPANT